MGKARKASLVERAGAGGVTVGVPALDVGDLEPAHEIGD